MFRLGEYVESSAVVSLEPFELGSQQYYLFNKYNSLEVHLLDREAVKLRRLFRVPFSSGVLQVKQIVLPDQTLGFGVLLENGSVEYYRFHQDYLELIHTIRFPSTDGLAYAPSFMENTSEILVVVAYRGSAVIKQISVTDNFPGFEVALDGVLILMKLAMIDESLYLFLVTQSDNLEESGLVVYRIIGGRRAEFITSLKLPSDFHVPSLMIQLDRAVLIIAGTKGLLVQLEENNLLIKNDFLINTQIPSSYLERKTIIGVASNVYQTSFGQAFLASTNKGELICFEHRNGQFLISPVTFSASDSSQPRPLLTALHYSETSGYVLATGENMDGHLMKYSPNDYSLESVRNIPNWAPIIDLDSTEKKNGLVMASSGISGICGALHQVRRGVKNSILAQSDQCFRGASKIWPLKRYKSDRHHSFVAVSFTNSTFLFSLKNNELETVSSSGLETNCPTLTMANLDTTSFWIQVCPDRVLAVKICEPDVLNAPVATIWKPEGFNASAAVILKNFVLVMDEADLSIRILSVTCQIAKGTSEILEIGKIPIPHRQGTALAAFPLMFGAESEFLLSAACDDFISNWKVSINEGFHVEPLSNFAITKPVNSLCYWKNSGRLYFAVGYRNGDAKFYSVLDHYAFKELLTTHIGSEPVRTVMVKEQGKQQTLCCTSRGVWFIAHGPDGSLHPEKFHPHIECFAEIYTSSNTKQKTFIATKRDTITILEAELEPTSWLYRMFSGPDLRRILLHGGTSIISSVSSPSTTFGQQNSLEMFKLSDLESVLRTKIPAHISSICPLSRPGYFAVASIDAGGQGTVHVYCCSTIQDKERDSKEKHSKRRSSIADIKRQPASFSFVASSSGFYSGISCLCEVIDGLLLLSCDTDMYLLNMDYEDNSLQIFRSEPRRSRAFCLAPRKTSKLTANVAIYDEDGLEIIQIDMKYDTVFRHLRGDTSCRSGGKVAWLDDRYIVVTEKTGLVSVVDTADPTSIWLKTLQEFRLQDIPYSICPNPEKPSNVLIGTMLGAILELTL